MNNVRIIPFNPEHVKLMDIRGHELEAIFGYEDIQQRLEICKERGACGTIMWGNTILGVMGYAQLWKGVCEVWIIPCTSIPKHALIFAKRVKKSLKLLVETKYFHRIQTVSLDNGEHERWHTWLGFKSEGTLKQYSAKKEDFKMWSLDIKE